MPDSVGIEFSVKELFLEVNRKIDMLMETFHMKADKNDLVRVETMVTDIQRRGSDTAQAALTSMKELEVRVDKLEKETATNFAVDANREQIVNIYRSNRFQWLAIVVALAGMVVTVLLEVVKH